MNEQEFIDKMESEGMDYAFNGYGLSEEDLDESLRGTDFWLAVRDARIAFNDAQALGARIYAVASR